MAQTHKEKVTSDLRYHLLMALDGDYNKADSVFDALVDYVRCVVDEATDKMKERCRCGDVC